MDCPRCGVEMNVADQQGMEIDYCPVCHGVWLDQGELHKIVSLTSSAILEVAKTMAAKLVSLDGEPGTVTLIYGRSANRDEDTEVIPPNAMRGHDV